MSELDYITHVKVHSGLSRLAIIIKNAEDSADQRVPLGRRKSREVMETAHTKQGRALVAHLIELFYLNSGSWWAGAPEIGTAFSQEVVCYISGAKTSLPSCARGN